MQLGGLFSATQLSRAKCAAITIIYFVVILSGILQHELWLDEAHHFLLSAYSNSIAELLFNARYDGHPVLWDALVYVMCRFSSNPLYMQLLNVLLCCMAVWLFIRHAPFSLLFKILSISGYYFIYEYSLISRNYALSCLCLFAALGLYAGRKQQPVLFALAVSVLANTHLLATALSAALLIQMALEYIFSDKKERIDKIFTAMAIMALGISFALWQVIPPAHNFEFFYVHHAFPYAEQAWKVYATPFRSMFNLCDVFNYYSWNSNLFTDHWWKFCRLLFPLPFIMAFIMLAKKPLALIFFILSVAGIMLTEYFALSADARHYGFIYLSFIAALWMAKYELESSWPGRIGGLNALLKLSRKPAEVLVWLILTQQVISGGILYGKDFYQPFNEGKQTCNYLRQNGLQRSFIMASNQSLGPVISAYLHRPVYHTEAEQEATFCHWNILPWTISDSSLIARINAQLAQHDSIILLLDNPAPALSIQSGKITLLHTFNKAFVNNGNYWVYLVKRND